MKGGDRQYLVSEKDLNAMGTMVRKLPIELGLNLWNKIIEIANNNEYDPKPEESAEDGDGESNSNES